jgi:FkbM family methyltransferase
MRVDRGIRVRIRGLWFHIFLTLSNLVSGTPPAKRLFHFLKLLPYRPRFSTKDVVQLVVGNNLFLTHLESSSSPELVMRNYARFSSSLEEDDIVFDVGAHVGAFSIRSGKRLNKGLVISFEPHPDIYQLLKLNVYLNRLNNVVPLNIAVADFHGKAVLSVTGDPASAYLGPTTSSKRTFEVQVRTIDDVCLEKGIDRVDFIKIHAEGSEMAILKGASNILAENKLGLLISSSRLRNSHVRKEACEHLLDIGFKIRLGGSPSHPMLFARKGKNTSA